MAQELRKEVVEDNLNKALEYPQKFYRTHELKRFGYTDQCLDFLLRNDKENLNKILCNIKKVLRNNASYQPAEPEKRKKQAEATYHQQKDKRRVEERLVLEMYLGYLNGEKVFCKIIDYQVPLKNKKEDTSGKIDFISKRGNNLLLVEIKQKDCNETSILNAILEIETYFRILDRADEVDETGMEKLKKDYGIEKLIPKKVVAVFKDSRLAKQYKDNEKIRDLAKSLEIEVYILKSHEEIELSND